jgi:hypothetical protein
MTNKRNDGIAATGSGGTLVLSVWSRRRSGADFGDFLSTERYFLALRVLIKEHV